MQFVACLCSAEAFLAHMLHNCLCSCGKCFKSLLLYFVPEGHRCYGYAHNPEDLAKDWQCVLLFILVLIAACDALAYAVSSESDLQSSRRNGEYRPPCWPRCSVNKLLLSQRHWLCTPKQLVTCVTAGTAT